MSAFIIIFGLIIGSFLTVCSFRIPLGRTKGLDSLDEPEEEHIETPTIATEDSSKKITIAYPPRSFCPQCNATLCWYHNIPFFSYLFLRGKCAFCKARIPFRYPFIELLSAIAAYGSYLEYGLTPTGILVYLFLATLIVISVIDYDYYIIPNVISLPGTVIGVALVAINQFFHIFKAPVCADLFDSVYGFLAGAGFLLLISYFYTAVRKKVGLGMGDVKLLAMTGVLFGPEASLYTIFIGSVLGSVLGIILLLVQGKRALQPIPFGPYLAGATALYLLGVGRFYFNFSPFMQ